ncbi:MAG: hypothetical protein ACYS8L_06820, partial [Planctomycetota bacterium]
MANWFKELDGLLRGDKSRPELLAEGTAHLRLGPHVGASVLLGAFYGLSMGLYSVLSRSPAIYLQLPSSAIKVPALFFLTLLVTFPSLYVFSALIGVRLAPGGALRVIVAAITVTLAVLASFAPITAFFTLTTTSYYFMKLLNVAFVAAAGVIGLWFLLRMLRRLDEVQSVPAEGKQGGNGPQEQVAPGGPMDHLTPGHHEVTRVGRGLFKVWMIVYMLVGA